MPSTTGFDYGVRQGLVSKGINNNDIGYNPTSGYVTVKGQNFIKPEKNYSGTTYTSSQNFNSAWNDYMKSQQQPAANVNTAAVNNPTTSYSPYNTQNPFDQQLNNLIQTLTQQAQNQQPVDVNQIYASPQYAAYQAQAQRGAQQGIRAAQESMGASGFGRSTALAERAQGIQNKATEYLDTQILPQLMAQAQAEKQQQLQNLISVLNPLMQQQGVYDDRFNQNRQFGLQEGQLTGQYLSDRDRQAMPLLEQLIAYGNEFGSADQQRQAELRAMADANRAALGNMGIDPSLYDPNLSTEQRIAALSRLGTPTMAMQNQQFNQNMAQTELMAALTGRMPDGTPTTAEQQRQLTNLWQVADQTGRIPDALSDLYGIPKGTPTQAAKQFAQQLAISQQNANTSRFSAETSRMNANWAQNPDNPDNIYRNLQIEQARNPEEKYSGMSANQVLNSIKSQYTEDVFNQPTNQFTQPQKIGERITVDPGKREQMFLQVIDSGLPDSDTDQVLTLLGLTKDEIKKFTDKYAK